MLPKLPPLRPAAIAARIDAAPNLVTLFLDRADEQPAAPFLVAKVGGDWRTISWGEARDIVASLSAALTATLTLPANARAGQSHLSAALRMLAKNPEAGIPLPQAEGVRALTVPMTPFTLIYRIKGRWIEFLRLRDRRQT